MTGYPVNDKLEDTTDQWRISQHCFADEIRSQMTLPDKVQLCDITLREGRQLPGVSLTRDQVLKIAAISPLSLMNPVIMASGWKVALMSSPLLL